MKNELIKYFHDRGLHFDTVSPDSGILSRPREKRAISQVSFSLIIRISSMPSFSVFVRIVLLLLVVVVVCKTKENCFIVEHFYQCLSGIQQSPMLFRS